jgi:hypothetical protein
MVLSLPDYAGPRTGRMTGRNNPVMQLLRQRERKGYLPTSVPWINLTISPRIFNYKQMIFSADWQSNMMQPDGEEHWPYLFVN